MQGSCIPDFGRRRILPSEIRVGCTPVSYTHLSGGEKTRVNLARIILEQTDILLLDEPTNHLDLDAVRWLGDYLETYTGTVVTVSHDRYFLDQCCDRIIEIQDVYKRQIIYCRIMCDSGMGSLVP